MHTHTGTFGHRVEVCPHQVVAELLRGWGYRSSSLQRHTHTQGHHENFGHKGQQDEGLHQGKGMCVCM